MSSRLELIKQIIAVGIGVTSVDIDIEYENANDFERHKQNRVASRLLSHDMRAVQFLPRELNIVQLQ